jgi:uncharacterized protein (TIGR04255 family)
MKIPKKITPCPIAEAIFEIRFDTEMPGDAIFGTFYNEFKDEFTDFEKLPILQLPEAIRSRDQNLIYSPHYKLKKDNFLIQIGPKVFSLVNLKDYSGWDTFSQKILVTFGKIYETGAVIKISRAGLRYVNIFENLDIYDKLNLKLMLGEKPFEASNFDLTTEVRTEKCVSRVKIANNATIGIEEKVRKGSVIDIDVVYKNNEDNVFENLGNVIEISHVDEKNLFFSLLDAEYIKALNPEY